MAAYGALVSVMHIIEQLQHHPHPPITLDKQQVELLNEKIAFLQEFLEVYNSHYSNQEMVLLRNRIADAAYAAEDIIESHIVDQIHDRGNISTSVDFYQVLQKVIENIDLIKKEVIEIKVKMGNDQTQMQRTITTPVLSSKSPSTQHNTMVGFDDALKKMLDKLTGQASDRQIIPISGMGGIGKTTLARNLYVNPLIQQHFDIHAWVTISQEYNLREILLDVLLCQNNQVSRESLIQMSEADLGGKLYQSLYGRKYLIVMDDMWSTDVWDKLKFFFPDVSGSRIIITTRLSNVASYLTSCYSHEMNFLNQDKSWNLLCKTVFGEEDCPPELVDIGMEIARNCNGLPLSIVVLGGLLAKSNLTREFWEIIAKKLNSNVNMEENELCLQILYTSYDQLPVHLKPCFLYMGTFPEDSKIRVSELIKTWVAEGFLKPVTGKSLEESAESYLIDLIGRNLILVGDRGSSERIKHCNIHDLLRDLCIREARKENFICVANHQSLNAPYEGINTQRRIAINQNTSEDEYHHSLKSASVARSLICYSREGLPSPELRLLRVFKRIGNDMYKEGEGEYSLEAIFQLVNLRYLTLSYPHSLLVFPSSVSFLWNLQTIIITEWWNGVNSPPTIWNMPLLRHVESNKLRLPNPPSGVSTHERDDFILQNLHTLFKVENLKLDEEVVKRIPNVKKLKLYYDTSRGDDLESDYCLNNLGRLSKLESLFCYIPVPTWPPRREALQNLTFPHSLKKLVLFETRIYWEDMNTKIGSLPFLQVLKLQREACSGSEWETVEEQFCSLKYLLMCRCDDLKDWITESQHFPCLEHLVLVYMQKFKEIPTDIGEIPTLKSIQLESCSNETIISAKNIQEEQEDVGNQGLQVRVKLGRMNDFNLRNSLESLNFQFKTW